jgi:GAF domain-containing protein
LSEHQRAGRSEELAALHAVASAANQSLELARVMRLSMDTALEVTRATTGALYLLAANSCPSGWKSAAAA